MNDQPDMFHPARADLGPSLHEVLALHGFTTERASHGKKHILLDGERVFTGTAAEVWKWLDGEWGYR